MLNSSSVSTCVSIRRSPWLAASGDRVALRKAAKITKSIDYQAAWKLLTIHIDPATTSCSFQYQAFSRASIPQFVTMETDMASENPPESSTNNPETVSITITYHGAPQTFSFL